MRRRVVAMVTLLPLVVAALGEAQVNPTFHGLLRVEPSVGTLDRTTGTAVVKARRWTLVPNDQESNGIRPEAEDVLVAIGEERFSLAAGSLHPRGGRRFVFRQRIAKGERGIKRLTLTRRANGYYRVEFTAIGVDLSRLFFEDPTCLPVAVVVGDDDGFIGVNAGSVRPFSRRIGLTGECQPQAWPWA
jgi:hypothetical protein